MVFLFVFFRFRSNSVFSGAVRSYAYAKDIDVFEKVGDRAKRGLQRKGGPPREIKKQNLHYGLCNQSYSVQSFTCEYN